jgi:hypothetical protein
LGPVTAEEDEAEEEGKGAVKEKEDVCAVRVVAIGMGMGWGGGGEGEWLYVIMTEERKGGHVCRCGAEWRESSRLYRSRLSININNLKTRVGLAAHAKLNSLFDFDFITRGPSH